MLGCQMWEQFNVEREALRVRFAEKLRLNMSFLVGDVHDADLLLVAADGSKLPAHQCILHQRAPGFYERFVEPTIVAATRSGNMSSVLEVAVGDVDSESLRFFVRSVYTEDEVARLPESSQKDRDVEKNKDDEEGNDSEASQHTYKMDESTDFGDFGGEDQEDAEEPPPQGDSLETSENTSLCRLANEDPTAMTSFLELATESPMITSASTERNESRLSTQEGFLEPKKEVSYGENAYQRFINLNKQDTEVNENIPRIRRQSENVTSKQIFQMFIGLEGEPAAEMWQSAPEGVRGRALAARQLSVNSLTSLTSIDISATEAVNVSVPDRSPSCKLAEDLLNMYLKNIDTDVVVKTDNGELFAHRCVLSATCPYFKNQLQKQRVKYIELKGYSRTAVHFFLSFLYGGLTSIGDDVDVYELVSLGTHLNVESLLELVLLYFRAKKCHFFHRPCATCVSAVFDALPHFNSIKCLQPLYKEALSWQAKHFARIWKGRVFAHLNPRWQKACFDAVLEEMDEEAVIEVMLGCERLQASLPYSRSGRASEAVLALVSDLLDFAQEFLLQSFDAVLLSESFRTNGKGLALNIGLLEDVFLPLVHSLSAETAIRSYLSLCQLVNMIRKDLPSPRRFILPHSLDVWNPRFLNLVRRLYELIDKHILHYAASAVKTESWNLLNPVDQQRIKETGIFVEMRQPRAPPPKFSSFNRAYKRSSSAGVQVLGFHERASSLERWRPYSANDQANDNPQALDGTHKMEVIQEKVPRRSNSLRVSGDKAGVERHIPVSKFQKPLTIQEEKKEECISNIKEQAEIFKETVFSSPKGSPRRKWTQEKIEKLPMGQTQAEIEEQRLERQHTQTVMSGLSKNFVVPKIDSYPTGKKVAKPKSVVKPMVNERRTSQTSIAGDKEQDALPSRSRQYLASRLRRTEEKTSVSPDSCGSASEGTRLRVQTLPRPSKQNYTPNIYSSATSIEKTKRRLNTDPRKEIIKKAPMPSRIPRSPKTARRSTRNDLK